MTGVDVFAEFCAAGLWPGLGRTTAGRLAGAGITSPEQVTPGRLAEVEGVGRTRADRLAVAFAEARPAYDTVEVLVPAGLPARLTYGALAHLGDTAAKQLGEDPWRLLAIPEVSPEQADYFARRLLGPAARGDDARRGRALVVHLLLRAARDGHTAQGVERISSALLGYGVADPAAAVDGAVDEGGVMLFPPEPGPAGTGGEAGGDVLAGPRTDPRADADVLAGRRAGEAGTGGDLPRRAGPGPLLALTRYALAEETVAEGVARLAATAEPVAADALDEVCDGLDEAQRAAVAAVARHAVCVLTGGPGTGKSRTVTAVVALARAAGLEVALAAPTGRAAKRLEELTGTEATTLHRLLGAQGTTGTFSRGEEWPLDADLVVVDEASMLDVELAAALIEACADGTRLLLVGDPAQLPSIGPGRVLADIMESGVVPVTELRTLYRQRSGGQIAVLATAVREGELRPVASPDREVVVVVARDGGEAAHRVVQLVTDSIPRALGIPTGEIQVVTPVHRGAAGTIALNNALKAVLNPGSGRIAGFDVGDRVVAVANHVDEGFANGEVGVVTGEHDDGLLVAFAGGPVVVSRKLLADLRHGWALTVHRAQGSEWPAVVAVFPGEAAGMLSRPLVYTALTRAERHLSVVHAAGPALVRAVRTVGERPRRTRLSALVAGAVPAG